MWTQFVDMHSGGRTKLPPYERIYIESESEQQAELIFYNKFNHDPNNVTCWCCGEDYSVTSHDDLEILTAYYRKSIWMDDYSYDLSSAKITMDEYFSSDNILKLSSSDISPHLTTGEMPRHYHMNDRYERD